MVQGHIDGIGKVSKVRYMAGSNEFSVEIPRNIRELVVGKGSITVDGISLTVASKTKHGFTLMVIPYTVENTTIGTLKAGDRVNIETDIVLRWLAERYPQENNINNTDTWDDNFSQIAGIHRED